MKIISSRANSLVGEWLDLLTSKGVRKHGQFLVSGRRAVAETLERFPSLARSLIVTAEQTNIDIANRQHSTRVMLANLPGNVNAIQLSEEIFKELDVAGTHEPLLICRTPEISEANLALEPQGLEILCAMGDPSNVGALLRSAAAFGASKVILLKECASPFHPKAVRAASATTLMTQLERGPSIKDIAQNIDGVKLFALDMSGRDLGTFKWPRNARLLIGEEGQGVPASKAFEFLSIPMTNNVESLNATVAASLALYSYSLSVQK